MKHEVGDVVRVRGSFWVGEHPNDSPGHSDKMHLMAGGTYRVHASSPNGFVTLDEENPIEGNPIWGRNDGLSGWKWKHEWLEEVCDFHLEELRWW